MRNNKDKTIMNSPYVETLIDPQSRKAYYPDFDQTTAHLKTILMNTVIRPPVDNFIIIFRPLHPNNNKVTQIFAFDATLGGYTWVMDLTWDEDLSLNYTKARPVSASLKVIGNTVAPSVNFTISGSINASDVQTLPDLRTLTFQSIPSFRRNPRDVVLNAQLMEGVTSLHHPEGQNPFRVLESNSSENTNNFVRFGLDANSYAEFLALGVNPDGNPAYLWSVVDGNMPSGLEGYVTLDVHYSYRNNNPAGLVFFNFNRRTMNPADWSTPVIITEVAEMTDNANFSMSIRHKMYFDSPLETIELFFPAADPADMQFIRISIEGENYYQQGYRDPATIIGISGFVPNTDTQVGQAIAISGVENYEATPDQELSRQIDTDSTRSEENPLVLMQVLNIISKGYIRFLWCDKDYQLFRNRQKATIADLQRLSNASGLGDLLNTVLGVVSPIVSDVAQTILPGTGSFIRGLSRAITSTNSAGLVPFSSAAGIVPYRTQPRTALDRNASMIGGTAWEDIMKSIKFTTNEVEYENFLELTWNSHSKRLCCDPLLINNITTGMQAGQWRNVAMSWLGCIFPYLRGEDLAFLGAIICSTAPVAGARNYMSIDYDYDKVQGTLAVSSDFDLEEDSIKSIIMAHVASGQPGMFVHVQRDIDDEVSTLSGGSLGLATFGAFLKRPSFAALTGAVDVDLEFYTPGFVDRKVEVTQTRSLILIVGGAPGDEEDDLYKQVDQNTVCSTNDIAFGDVNGMGVIQPIWSVLTIPAFTLATIYSLNGLNYKNIGMQPPNLIVEEYAPDEDKPSVTSYRPVRTQTGVSGDKSVVLKFWDDNATMLQAFFNIGKLQVDPSSAKNDTKIRMYSGAKDLLTAYERKLKTGWDSIKKAHPGMFQNSDDVVAYGIERWTDMVNNEAFLGALGNFDLETFKVLPGYLFGAISTYITAVRPKGSAVRKFKPNIAFPTKKGAFNPATIQKVGRKVTQPESSSEEEEVKIKQTPKGQVAKFQASMFGEPKSAQSVLAPKKVAEKIPPTVKPTSTLKAKAVPTPALKKVISEVTPAVDPNAAILAAIQGISAQVSTMGNRLERVEKKSRGGVTQVRRNAADGTSSDSEGCVTNCSDRSSKEYFVFYPSRDQQEIITSCMRERLIEHYKNLDVKVPEPLATNVEKVLPHSAPVISIDLPACDCVEACYLKALDTMFGPVPTQQTIVYSTYNNQPLTRLPEPDSKFIMQHTLLAPGEAMEHPPTVRIISSRTISPAPSNVYRARNPIRSRNEKARKPRFRKD